MKLCLSFLLIFLSLNSFACIEEAQVVSNDLVINELEIACEIRIQSMSFYRPSGICPLAKEDIINQVLLVDSKECQTIKEIGIARVIAKDNLGLFLD